MAKGDPILEVEHLVKYFPIKSGIFLDREVASVKAVDDVSFTLHEGETLGLVGESGCGKSTLCRTVLQLLKPTAGSVKYRGKELIGLSRKNMRPVRRSHPDGTADGPAWAAGGRRPSRGPAGS